LFTFSFRARMSPRTRRKTTHEPEHDAELHTVPPGLWLMMLEARAPWEAMALAAVSPWLSKMPSGDGHAVLVFPGLRCAASSGSMATRPMAGNRA
jgi:hypothetical protein